jgi:hypothetical protein
LPKRVCEKIQAGEAVELQKRGFMADDGLSLPRRSEIAFSFVPPDDELDGLDLEIVRLVTAKFFQNWRALEKPRRGAHLGRAA